MNKLLYKLTAHLPVRVIEVDDKPYLERYYVGKLFGVTFYLHRFVSEDGERHVHNHPWRWGRALILTGGYVEEVCADIGHLGPITYLTSKRWWSRVNGNTFHRIARVYPNTWTLFFHSERVPGKGWGFLDKSGYTPQGSAVHDWYEEAAKGGEINRCSL